MGRRDLEFTRMEERESTGSPELTREEYQRLLAEAEFRPLVREMLERRLEEEQMTSGWES